MYLLPTSACQKQIHWHSPRIPLLTTRLHLPRGGIGAPVGVHKIFVDGRPCWAVCVKSCSPQVHGYPGGSGRFLAAGLCHALSASRSKPMMLCDSVLSRSDVFIQQYLACHWSKHCNFNGKHSTTEKERHDRVRMDLVRALIIVS